MREIRTFTLLEMLAVMVLAAMLTALAVPAFRALTTGSAVGETTSIVKNMLDVAQSRAVSHRRYTGVVFDYRAERDDAESTQAVRLAEIKVTYDNSGTVKKFEFQRWLPDSAWRTLSYGAALLCAYENKDTKPVKSGAAIPADPGDLVKIASVWKGESGGSTFDGYGVIFSPYGGFYQPGTSVTFTIGEAKITPDKKFIFEDTDSSGAPANKLQLAVNQFTGRSEVLNDESDD